MGDAPRDGRTTCPPGYAISQRKRKQIEEPFAWGKMIGGLARPMLRGARKLAFKFKLTLIGYNLIAYHSSKHQPVFATHWCRQNTRL